MRLETERLVLREFVEGDWAALYAFESLEVVTRFEVYDPHTEVVSREYVAKTIASAAESPRSVIDLAITLRGDDTLIGHIGMKRSGHELGIGEVWYGIAPEHQRRGFVTEAARAFFTHAFTELGIHRLFGDCDPRNIPSARLMERLGMRREGHHVQNLWVKGEWCDSLIYAMLASEWNPSR